MQITIKCPYCSSEISFDVNLKSDPIKGPFVKECSNCSGKIDLIRLALVRLGSQDTQRDE
jgi:uncharacterized Zn finger protein